MSTIDPINNPNNVNGYPPATQITNPKKKSSPAVNETDAIQEDEQDENDDPIQWIDDALKDYNPSSSSSQTGVSPTKRQRTMGNNMNNKI